MGAAVAHRRCCAGLRLRPDYAAIAAVIGTRAGRTGIALSLIALITAPLAAIVLAVIRSRTARAVVALTLVALITAPLAVIVLVVAGTRTAWAIVVVIVVPLTAAPLAVVVVAVTVTIPVTARPRIGSSAGRHGASVKVSSRRMTASRPVGVGIDRS